MHHYFGYDLDTQIENITQPPFQKIENGVPCIEFKWVKIQSQLQFGKVTTLARWMRVTQSYIWSSKVWETQLTRHMAAFPRGRQGSSCQSWVGWMPYHRQNSTWNTNALGSKFHLVPFFLSKCHAWAHEIGPDGFIKILLQNVQAGAQKNFQAKSSDAYNMHRTPFRRGCPGCAKLGSNKVIVEQGIGDGTRHQTT